MKLTRRSFLGLLSAIPFAPLVAKDMGDFEFLPSEVVTIPQPLKTITKIPLPIDGQLRYNINSNLYEVYGNNQWNIITMEERQDV